MANGGCSISTTRAYCAAYPVSDGCTFTKAVATSAPTKGPVATSAPTKATTKAVGSTSTTTITCGMYTEVGETTCKGVGCTWSGTTCTGTVSTKTTKEADAIGASINDQAKVQSLCTDSCVKLIIRAYLKLLGSMSKCSMPAATGTSESNPAEELEKVQGMLKGALNVMCQKNEKGNYCASAVTMSEKALTAQDKKMPTWTSSALTCDNPGLTALTNLGCCYGSMMQMLSSGASGAASMVGKKDEKYLSVGYYVNKCGGNILPCGEGALESSTVIKSSMTFSGSSFTQEFMEKESTRRAIKAGIQKTCGKYTTGTKKDKYRVQTSAIVITKVTITTRRLSEATQRKLAAGATVEYSVVQSAEDAADTTTALKTMNPATLAASVNSELPTPIANLKTEPSTSVTTDTVTAVPPSTSIDSGISGGVIAGIVVGCLAAVAIAVVATVMIMKNRQGAVRQVSTGAVTQQAAAAGAGGPENL